MEPMNTLLEQYLSFCQDQKELDEKTLKAYRIDLRQFRQFVELHEDPLSKSTLESYCRELHRQFKPRTAKRKLASAKAFCHWLEYEEIVDRTPFAKVHTKFREPQTLPRVISLSAVTAIFQIAYRILESEQTPYDRKIALRNTAVLELMFATGVRVSELCHLTDQDIDLEGGKIRVYGKGEKERVIQIGNSDTIRLLQRYRREFLGQIVSCGFFFVNRQKSRLTEQSVRQLLAQYAKQAGVSEKVTPHMFRHTVATLLLEAGVDIRYIQQFLGHSSISITEIYTHVSTAKQKEILVEKHPRNKMAVSMQS